MMKKYILALAILFTVTTSLLAATVENETSVAKKALVQNENVFVASKNGTKYHSPSCITLKRVKNENIVTFASREEAKKANFSACKKCLAQ